MSADVTRLLNRWQDGEEEALERLMPEVYGELRRLAASFLRSERRDHTLQPTALVHEAFLRLVEQQEVDWQSRAHFYGIAARLMRRTLVDHARRKSAKKRGGPQPTLSLTRVVPGSEPDIDVVALDQALERLAGMDPRQVRLVELRYFGGLTIAETAEVMDISPATVKREWSSARAWLFRELGGAS